MIADDEPGMRVLIEQTLESLEDKGVELLHANSGKQALEIIKKESPDLVLLDVMMLEMSGFDVCNTVKEQKLDKQMGKDVGVNYYITKPFDLDDVFEKVDNIFGIEM